MKTLKILSLLALASIAAAGEVPEVTKFSEGEALHVSLSKLNFNRIFIEGESIIKVSYLKNAFLVEKDRNEEQDGSIYLKPLSALPLTLFIVTNENHHLSLTVSANLELGKTIALVSKESKGFNYRKAKEEENARESDVLAELMEGRAPTGFTEEAVQSKPFNFHHQFKLTLMKQYRSDDKTAYVYQVENKTKNVLELTPKLFENNKLLNLELTQSEIKPNEIAYFYGIYREG